MGKEAEIDEWQRLQVETAGGCGGGGGHGHGMAVGVPFERSFLFLFLFLFFFSIKKKEINKIKSSRFPGIIIFSEKTQENIIDGLNPH